MKPKLIVINGPCGIGKNTIANLYKNNYPTAVLLDIDEVRRNLHEYQEHREESYTEAVRLVIVDIVKYLDNGTNVVVSNIITNSDVMNSFQMAAEKAGADFYEFILWADKKEAIDRAIKRGFKAGSLLQESNLSSLYDDLEKMLKERNKGIVINSVEGDIKQTYAKVVAKINN